MGRPHIPIAVGQRFGRLVVLNGPIRRHKEHLLYEFVCDCGRICEATSANVRYGTTKSCGCLLKDALRETCNKNVTHGRSRGITYKSWVSMKSRAGKRSDYANRKLCSRWRLFENFLADMGERPSKGHTVDRVDNSLGYEPGNCRWATRSQQQRNKRSNVIVEYDGKSLVVIELFEMLNISRSALPTFYNGIRAGKSTAFMIDKLRRLGYVS